VTGSAIPGEPNVITGTVPVVRRDRPPTTGDTTPVTTEPIRGRPARHAEQRLAPSLIVVGSLLIVALIVAFVLYIGIDRGDGGGAGTADTIAPPGSSTPSGAAAEAASDASAAEQAADPAAQGDAGAGATIAPTDVRIATIQAWDPDGDNGTENDAQAGLAFADGSGSTAWPTECYSNEHLGSKRGVGLILSLSGPSTGTVHVESLNGPYQVEVRTSAEATAPTDLDAWQPVGDPKYGEQPGAFEVTIDSPASFVLVWLTQLGRDEACTEKNPYRGRLGEITFRP
jgi:hypothetical protein